MRGQSFAFLYRCVFSLCIARVLYGLEYVYVYMFTMTLSCFSAVGGAIHLGFQNVIGKKNARA